MNHAHVVWIDLEQALDVAFGFAGDSDDCIRHFQSSFLNPQTEIVTAAELLTFPWPQWFQRVNRDDKRNSVIQFRQNAAEMTVPGVTMHQIGIDVGRVEIGAATDCAESGLQRLWAREIARVQSETSNL